MTYAIIGFGSIGQALAKAFVRRDMEVAVASRRTPEELATQAKAIGQMVVATTLPKALEADVIMLAVPFWQHVDVAKAVASWEGKTVIDVMNAFGVPVEELDGHPSSVVVARALPGARFVKGFNHLPAKILATDPAVHGGRRVVFLSSEDEDTAAPVKAMAEELGFAPVWLGKLSEGGTLVQARGPSWAPLIFQDVVKFE